MSRRCVILYKDCKLKSVCGSVGEENCFTKRMAHDCKAIERTEAEDPCPKCEARSVCNESGGGMPECDSWHEYVENMEKIGIIVASVKRRVMGGV